MIRREQTSASRQNCLFNCSYYLCLLAPCLFSSFTFSIMFLPVYFHLHLARHCQAISSHFPKLSISEGDKSVTTFVFPTHFYLHNHVFTLIYFHFQLHLQSTQTFLQLLMCQAATCVYLLVTICLERALRTTQHFPKQRRPQTLVWFSLQTFCQTCFFRVKASGCKDPTVNALVPSEYQLEGCWLITLCAVQYWVGASYHSFHGVNETIKLNVAIIGEHLLGRHVNLSTSRSVSGQKAQGTS